MKSLLRRFGLAPALVLSLALPVAVGAAPSAHAFPDKPVFLVVPYPPGGANDVLARIVNQPLADALGQPVVVENKGGAGGNVGTRYTIDSAPDGYTIMLHGMSVAVNATLYKDANYNPVTDLTPVAMVAQTPLVVVVPKSLPVNDMKELVAYIKAHPGEVNYASGGAGTSLHLAAENFKAKAGLDMTHIPYRGNAKAMPDLVSGQTQVLFSSIGTALPHIESGALKPLAVTTGTRASVLPNVPTVAEAGFPEFEFGAWYAILAPAKTPIEVREQLNAAFQKVLSSDDVKTKLLKLSAVPTLWSVAQTGDFIKTQYETWGDMVKKVGLTIE